MNDNIEIELSKTKILLLLTGAIAFIILGTLLTLNPESFLNPIFTTTFIIRIIGITAIVFFGICTVFISRKLLDTKIGLIINQKGIIDNTNATSVGLIEWADIINIFTIQIASTKILILETDKPEKYIERAKNKISKRAMKANYKMYGSPISIISNSLKIKYDDLEKLINQEFTKQKNS